MASSTTTPSDNNRPISESVLKLRSILGNQASAPKIATGMPALTHRAKRTRKNKDRLRITSSSPLAALSRIAPSRPINSLASLFQMVRCNPSGKARSLASTYSSTLLDISSALSLPTRHIWMSIVGSPLSSAYWSISSKPSTIVAISLSNNREPSGWLTTTMS